MTPSLSLYDALDVPAAVLFRQVDDETVLLNTSSGLYFGLDAVGTRLWQLIVEHGSLQRVFERALAEYAVRPEELEGDLLQLASELCDKGLVQVRTSAAASGE